MSKDESIAAQELLAENVHSGSLDAGLESFATHALDHGPAPGQGLDREWFAAFFTELTGGFPDAKIEPAHTVDDDVAVAYPLTGIHQADFYGIAATGNTIEIRGTDRALRARPDRRALGFQ